MATVEAKPVKLHQQAPLFLPIPMQNGNDDLIAGIVGSHQCNISPSPNRSRKDCVEVHLIIIVTRTDNNPYGQVRIAGLRADPANICHQLLETEVPAFQAVKANADVDLVIMLQPFPMAAQAMTEAIT